jgi:putative hydrolase of the HAD superfamily
LIVTHLFFDVGGVLGTRGWDTGHRRLAAEHFGMDPTDLEARHQRIVERFEKGDVTLSQYVDSIAQDGSLPCTHDEFATFMFAQSSPFPEVIALARGLRDTGRYRLMTINNESAELNVYRLRHFGLTGVFSTFFSSCWLHAAKPSPRIYELALQLSQAQPECAIFIDDRAENLPPARALGMRTILFRGLDRLVADLAESGVALAGTTDNH